LFSPIDLEDDLTQVPLVTGLRQPAADPVGASLVELAAPLSQRLVADHDAAEGQHFLHHPQAAREAEIEPHCLADVLF
jgi:hypothetical protein